MVMENQAGNEYPRNEVLYYAISDRGNRDFFLLHKVKSMVKCLSFTSFKYRAE